MRDNNISQYRTIPKLCSDENLHIEQKHVKSREWQNEVMSDCYQDSICEFIGLEKFLNIFLLLEN